MKVISVFAGIGGFDLGFERAGCEVVAHVEKDPQCLKLLAAPWPNAVALPNVLFAGASTLPPCDILCGGWPCQDLSVAGLRAGLVNGSRSNLFYELTRLIRELRPRYFIGENVPGLLSSDGGRDFARVLGELGKCGARDIAWRIMDAQYLGVAQRRRRVFIIADFGGERAGEILSLAEGLRGYPAPSREAREGVAGAPAACLNSGGSGGGFRTEPGAHLVCRDVTHSLACHMAKGGDPNTDNYVAHTLRGEGFDASEDGTGRGTPLVATAFAENSRAEVRLEGGDGDRTGALSTGGGKPGQGAPMIVTAYRTAGNCGPFEQGDKTGALNTNTDQCQQIIAIQEVDAREKEQHGTGIAKEGDAMFTLQAGAQHGVATTLAIRGRGDSHELEYRTDGTANAILTPNGGRGGIGVGAVEYRSAVRRLTPRECERLQGFPDDWTAGFSDSTRYRMLGNAVAVPCAEWIARNLMR